MSNRKKEWRQEPNQKSDIDDLLSDDINPERTSFEKLEISIKKVIFNVLFVLLQDEETVKWQFVVITILDFLILIQFTFLPICEFPWKAPDLEHALNTFLDYFQVPVWLAKIDFDAYLIIFYISLFFVVLVILDIFYVSYSFSRKKFTFVWPLQALRSVASLFVTVLFLPILDVFSSMHYCVQSDEIEGAQVLDAFPYYVCYESQHIIHYGVSIVISIIFILICCIIAFAFFDMSFVSKDIKAAVNNRGESLLLAVKIFLQYLYIFFGNINYHWLLIISMLIVSYTTFNQFKTTYAFFNDFTSMVYSVVNGVWLWSNVCLAIVKILENTEFTGGFQLLFLGTPLIAGIIIFDPDARKNLLLKNINNFQQQEQLAIQIRYFIKLIQTRHDDRRNAIILKGYIYHHEDNCPYQQCQLKNYKNLEQEMVEKRRRSGKSTHDSDTYYNLQIQQQMHQILLQHAKSLYRAAVQKFPNSAELRIQYAFFLIELMNDRTEGLKELNLAANCNPSFVEQFVIFRQMKSTDDVGTSSSEDKNMDVISKYAFESTVRQFREEIKKAAEFHQEFWLHLKSDRPDMSKISDVGLRINRSVKQIENFWNQLTKLKSNSAPSFLLYSQFIMNILNDKERASEFQLKAREQANIKGNVLEEMQIAQDDQNDLDQIEKTGFPCVSITRNDKNANSKFSINYANLSVCKMFGYIQNELKNHHVEKLMPDVYGRHHAKLVEQAYFKVESNKDNNTNPIMQKERLVYARHKSGFIFPVFLQLKYIQTSSSGTQFLALFKLDKKLMNSNQTYIILNKDKKIQGFSSSIMVNFEMTLPVVQKLEMTTINVEKLAPDLFQQVNDFNNEMQAIIEWHVPEIKTEQQNQLFQRKNTLTPGNRGKLDFDINKVPKRKIKFYTSLSPINIEDKGLIGWIVKIQKQQDQLSQQIQQNKKAKQSLVRQPLFQFRYNEINGKFIRELRDPRIEQNKDTMLARLLNQFSSTLRDTVRDENPNLNQSDLVQPEHIDIQIQQPLIGVEESNPNTNTNKNLNVLQQKKKWGQKISIYKLVNGKFFPKDYDEEQKNIEALEKQRLKESQEQDNDLVNNKKDAFDLSNIPKTRQLIQHAFNDKATPRPITNLRLVMSLVIAFLIALSVTEYQVNVKQFQTIYENMNIIEKSFDRLAEIQKIAYNIRTLVNYNEGLQNETYFALEEQEEIYNHLICDIEKSLEKLYEQHTAITMINLELNEAQDQIINQRTVKMYFKDSRAETQKTIKFNLNEAILQIASAVFTIKNMNFTMFTENQEDIYFVTQNAYADFYEALENSSNMYVQELYQRQDSKLKNILIIYIVTVCVTLFSTSFVIPVVNQVNQARVNILSLFVDVPNDSLDALQQKCEDFLVQFEEDFQNNENEIQTVSDDAEIFKNDNSLSNHTGRRGNQSKIPINLAKSNARLQKRIAAGVIIVVSYFTAFLIYSILNLEYFAVMTKELHVLSQCDHYYSLALNIQREMFYNQEKPMMGNFSLQVAIDTLQQLHIMNEHLLKYHFLDRSTNNYYLSFNDLYFNHDLCNQEDVTFLNHELFPDDCSSLLNNAPQYVRIKFHQLYQGLQTVITKYYELLKQSLHFYIQQYETSLYKTMREFQQAMFNSQYQKDLYIAHFGFLSGTFRYLKQLYIDQIDADFTSINNIQTGSFVGFILGIIAAYLLVWIPFVNNLNREVQQTKRMLGIIPIEVIQRMPKLQRFLNDKNFFTVQKKKQLTKK